MFMQKLRASTKTILWIVVIAFILWLFIELGASLTGFGGRTKPWQKGILAEVEGVKINYEDFERMISYAIQETLRTRPNKNLTPSELQNIREYNFFDVVRKIKLSKFDEKYRNLAFSSNLYTQILLINPPQEVLQDTNFYTNGQFDRNKFAQVLNDPRNRDYVINQIYRIRLDLLQELTGQDLALSLNISKAERAELYKIENTRFKIKYLGIKLYQIPDTAIPVEIKDLQAYYKKNKDKFRLPPRAAMKIAEFKVIPTVDDTSMALERANTVIELFKQGEKFENLVRDFSDDAGEFGWIKKGDAKFDTIYKAVSELKIGEVAGPIRFRDGFYVFQVTEKARDSVKLKDVFIGIRASENTYSETYRKAQEFLETAKKKGFEKAAKDLNINLLDTQEFNIEGFFIPYVSLRNEAVKKFVKESRKKAISDIIKDEDSYKVFYIYYKDKGRIPEFEDNEVRGRIKGMYLADKKMEIIKNELDKAYKLLKQGIDMDSIPQKLSFPCTVEETEYFTAKTIPSRFIGRDIKFSGFIYSLKDTGKIYSPYLSYPSGGYIVKLLERIEPSADEIEKNSKFNVGQYQRIWDLTYREFMQKFFDISDIKDYRNYYYSY